MRIPSTTELVTALKSKDKEQIKEAKLKLKKEGDKYFASVPFPDVERMVAKEMLKTYDQLHSCRTTNQHLRNHQFSFQGKY